MIRRPPRSTLDRSSAASDVYKRQVQTVRWGAMHLLQEVIRQRKRKLNIEQWLLLAVPVSYTHLRAHETVLDLVCRLLLEKKQNKAYTNNLHEVIQPKTKIRATVGTAALLSR